MATCTFTNLTKEQAEILADWYCGQGEQDAMIWFEDRDIETPMTDCSRKGGHTEIDKEGNVTVYCK